KAIIKIEDIIYMNYCRLSRKTEITTKDGKIYYSKRGFAEVEQKLKGFSFFIKVDRGTLINRNLLKEIDYKGEKITFLGNKNLFVSRSKLKILEENLDLFGNRIEL
ncbi:LytTR family transcriptional regulator DNA-binding domain-containing protein, partial [Cetobacterium sp.]